MKKLFLKQKLEFSAVEKFTVKNENEEDCYIVQGNSVQVGGKTLHVLDMNENKLLSVHQKLLALMPKFFVYKGEAQEQVAEIQKKMAFLGSKYIIEGPGWEVKGKFTDHDYKITKDGNQVASLHKAWISLGDCYEIDIEDGVDDTLVLAVVLAINMVLENEAMAADS